MQYLVSLVVFASIGSFIITDTTVFWKRLSQNERASSLWLDFARILLLVGLASIGYLVGSETFQKPGDQIFFLVTGALAAVLINILLSFRRI
jgi:hypothetical protein